MGKIQERCCQGLSASSASQRAIVEADACADAPLDDQPVQLSAREARERHALACAAARRRSPSPAPPLPGGKRARTASAVVDRQDRPAAPRRSASATTTPSAARSRGGGRSRRSSSPRQQAARSSPATLRRAASCSGQPAERSSRASSSLSSIPKGLFAMHVFFDAEPAVPSTDRARINDREHRSRR